jgi:GNAT superfamily N-acetyltransferase
MHSISRPAPLSDQHFLEHFDCGEASLNDWLKKTAFKNQSTGASRCFVICKNNQVLGYYSLSSGAISRSSAPKGMQRNTPTSLPVIVMGRLAIDKKYHNQGLGKALLRDAMLRIVNASAEVGIFAMLIHALSSSAKQFYLSCGFVESPLQPMTLMMTVKTIQGIICK